MKNVYQNYNQGQKITKLWRKINNIPMYSHLENFSCKFFEQLQFHWIFELQIAWIPFFFSSRKICGDQIVDQLIRTINCLWRWRCEFQLSSRRYIVFCFSQLRIQIKWCGVVWSLGAFDLLAPFPHRAANGLTCTYDRQIGFPLTSIWKSFFLPSNFTSCLFHHFFFLIIAVFFVLYRCRMHIFSLVPFVFSQ